ETLAKPELERILAPVRKRPPHNTFAGFGKRTPSDRPPIEIPEALRKAVTANGATNGTANGQGRALPGLEPDVDAPAPPPGDSGAFGPPQHHGAPYGGYIPPTDSGYEQPGRHGQGGGQGPA
ncbi:MAG: Cell division protein FtsH, partial [Pseudonocardiales bacterium]|nr:Cell division protein FtsH [Pseudonocardiales bacterium]